MRGDKFQRREGGIRHVESGGKSGYGARRVNGRLSAFDWVAYSWSLVASGSRHWVVMTSP